MTIFNSNINNLTLDDFDFVVPPELIAHEPLSRREESKLLIFKAPRDIRVETMINLPSILPKGSVLIFNNSKVFPSRLIGQLPTGGKIEIFLTKKMRVDQNSNLWWALGKPLKKIKVGTKLTFSTQEFDSDPRSRPTLPTLSAQVLEREKDQILLSFDHDEQTLNDWLDLWGIVPLPPYIKRNKIFPAGISPDRDRYQTVFAKVRGSVAAPTAGLHFTDNLLKKLQEQEIKIRYVSLHVGLGTFLPVKSEKIDDHQMHFESYCISRETVEEIILAKNEGRPVIAVGTTSFRCLEDLYRISNGLQNVMLDSCDLWHETNLFLFPESRQKTYKPWIIDGIITNFHQPKSTLIMLVASLVGLDQTLSIYNYAIENNFRLFSYGDSSLLWL